MTWTSLNAGGHGPARSHLRGGWRIILSRNTIRRPIRHNRLCDLKIERLSKTYPNGVHAPRDVSLAIPPGMYGLVRIHTELRLSSHTRPRRLSARIVFALLAAACATACAPFVTHSPRVVEGLTFYGTAGGGRTLCDRPNCDTTLTPQQGVGLRFGHAASASAPGLSAGVTGSPGWVFSDLGLYPELDLYAQAPLGLTPFDAGTGVLLSPAHVMPYVQAGRMKPDGSG